MGTFLSNMEKYQIIRVNYLFIYNFLLLFFVKSNLKVALNVNLITEVKCAFYILKKAF